MRILLDIVNLLFCLEVRNHAFFTQNYEIKTIFTTVPHSSALSFPQYFILIAPKIERNQKYYTVFRQEHFAMSPLLRDTKRSGIVLSFTKTLKHSNKYPI